jgi:hypothetical protein
LLLLKKKKKKKKAKGHLEAVSRNLKLFFFSKCIHQSYIFFLPSFPSTKVVHINVWTGTAKSIINVTREVSARFSFSCAPELSSSFRGDDEA